MKKDDNHFKLFAYCRSHILKQRTLSTCKHTGNYNILIYANCATLSMLEDEQQLCSYVCTGLSNVFNYGWVLQYKKCNTYNISQAAAIWDIFQ